MAKSLIHDMQCFMVLEPRDDLVILEFTDYPQKILALVSSLCLLNFKRNS